MYQHLQPLVLEVIDQEPARARQSPSLSTHLKSSKKAKKNVCAAFAQDNTTMCCPTRTNIYNPCCSR
jgi:hypothetical protein